MYFIKNGDLYMCGVQKRGKNVKSCLLVKVPCNPRAPWRGMDIVVIPEFMYTPTDTGTVLGRAFFPSLMPWKKCEDIIFSMLDELKGLFFKWQVRTNNKCGEHYVTREDIPLDKLSYYKDSIDCVFSTFEAACDIATQMYYS